MTKRTTLRTKDLAQFTGTKRWYRHALNRAVLFTDGARYVADTAGGYWLLDVIALVQPRNKRIAEEAFQVWKLMVHDDRSATLTCDDGNGTIIYTQHIPFTDFALEEITLYFTDNVILLPSEY